MLRVVKKAYIDKAIMELEAHNRGNTSRFPEEGLLHDILDYVLSFWTSV